MIVDKYRILGTLGEGGMGTVYRAEQLGPDGEALREVALKTVHAAHASNEVFARRFLREVRVTASLSNPHAVTVYDAGRTPEGALYFAMELIRGETLGELLKREAPLPPQRAARIAQQICDALADAHKPPLGIVHRDLKPPNVFVIKTAGGDHVKVADFGIAKLANDGANLTSTGFVVGTPRYMPPEQWRGEEIDGRADLYSLGAMTYEMLAGAPPFPGTLEAMMFKHLNEAPPPLPPAVPQDLRDLVMSLLEKDRERRPADAGAAREAFERIAARQPAPQAAQQTVATPAADATELLQSTAAPGKPAPAALPARGRGGLVGSVVALALVLALGAALYLRFAAKPARAPDTAPPQPPPAPPAVVERGFVESITDPDGADVYVDGKMVGRTPFTLEVPPGRYEVELRKAGYYTARQTAVVKPNQRVQIELALVAEETR